MYTRQIFAILSLLSLAPCLTAFNFYRISPDNLGLPSVAQMNAPISYVVEEQLNELNKKVHSRMPAAEKVRLLRSTLENINNLRKNAPLESIGKELNMDFSTGPLERMASDEEFSVMKCEIYKTKMMVGFAPYASFEEGPRSPPLKRAFQIMQGICG